MKKFLTLGALAIAFSATAAFAVGAGWNGPGWYIVMDTPVKNQALYRGAYRTREDCLAARPDDKGSVTYECVQFDHEPLDN